MPYRVKQAYTHPLRTMETATLCTAADVVRELIEHPGWKLVQACVDAHAGKLNEQLLNPTIRKIEEYASTTAEIRGLRGAREAAETIVAFAVEREREANERQQAQEQS